VNAWGNLGGFRGEAKVTTWLTRIAANAAIDRLRRIGREAGRRVAAPVEELAEILPSPKPATDEAAVNREFSAAFDRAREALSPHQRAVFELHATGGRPFADVAGTLGMSESSARQHYFRAMKRLRVSLEEYR
jgi:RNA polymerase sigma-70 factor (ECF subfamily)